MESERVIPRHDAKPAARSGCLSIYLERTRRKVTTPRKKTVRLVTVNFAIALYGSGLEEMIEPAILLFTKMMLQCVL